LLTERPHRRWERALDSPAFLATGVAVAAAAFAICRLEVFAHGDITRFIDVGSAFAKTSETPRGVTVAPGSGYDGQFYYRLALDPADLHRSAFGITMDNAYRVQRITYSVLAWLAAGGQQGAVPYSLVGVNIFALGALAWLGAVLARDCGRRPAWGLLIAAYFGFLFSLGRDLTEICEACFVVAGLLLLRRGMPVLAGLALAAAALSRETALVVVAGAVVVAAVDVARGRRRFERADFSWIVPVVAYAGWQLIGWRSFGSIPFRTDTENNLTYPFVSLVQALGHNLAQLPSEHAGIWLVELAVLGTVTVSAAVALSGSRATPVVKCSWTVSALLAVFLTKTLWESHADFRGFEDLYVLSSVVLLASDRHLKLIVVFVSAMWVVTFFHRVLLF
jgi:hypothetical protein